MTDQQRARAESRARLLAELGLTRAESALFTALHYGITIPPSDFPAAAAQEDYNPTGPVVTEEECRVAMTGCFTKGWLRVIDEPTRAKIGDDLQKADALGPIYGGLPEVGCVDFTDAGAELRRRLSEGLRSNEEPAFAYTDGVHEKTAKYFRTRAAAVAAIKQASGEDEVVTVTGPSPTGPWRAQWWRQFPEGYRVDVEERRQWQGRGPGGQEECYLQRHPQKADMQRLRQVLDRHNVTSAEWLLLAAMERGWFRNSAVNLCRGAAESSEEQVGVLVSEKECRSGLEACLRYGWLRVIDRQVIDEIHALLRNDPAHLALPKTAEIRPEGCRYSTDQLMQHGKLVPIPMPADSRYGEVDFSPDGAALYRMISTEWLGPDWEDDLSVSHGYYWEEHHYSEAEEGFQSIVQKHVAQGENIRASRVVPIGPWCVYWWRRFPAGYRLELELGEP